jgi:hypothetical protein
MNDTDEHRRPTQHAKDFVARNFAPRTYGSLASAIALFAFAGLAITATVGHVEPHYALYSAGLTSGACGIVMMIGWGASSGHGGVAMCMAVELERRARQLDTYLAKREEELNDRLNEIIENQQKLAKAMTANRRDELEHRRHHN